MTTPTTADLLAASHALTAADDARHLAEQLAATREDAR